MPIKLEQSIFVDCSDALETHKVSVIKTKKTPLLANKIKQTWAEKPKVLLLIILLEAVTVYGMLFFVPAFSAPQVLSATETPQEQSLNHDRLIALTNQARNEFNLDPLTYNNDLTVAAEQKAKYILANNNFAHEGINGETFSYWIRETEYNYIRVGENLAIHYTDPDAILAAWMDSPSHRKNVLNPYYEDIGIAVIQGEYNNRPTTVVVQLFGTPNN